MLIGKFAYYRVVHDINHRKKDFLLCIINVCCNYETILNGGE